MDSPPTPALGDKMAQHAFRLSTTSEETSSRSLRRAAARARAIAFLKDQNLSTRRTADGVPVGIQATIATGQRPVTETGERKRPSDLASGEHSIDALVPPEGLDLYTLLDAMVAHPDTDPNTIFGSDPMRAGFLEIISLVEKKLGFPLEPELFSNMLVGASLGGDTNPDVRSLCHFLLSTFRDLQADGLYHFFVSMQFACDVDCTAMAARARLATGDVDLTTRDGAFELRRITDAILRSASVCDVESWANLTHGKENGSLPGSTFSRCISTTTASKAPRPTGVSRSIPSS